MGLDISVVKNLKPIEIPEGIEDFSNEYYEWEEETYPFLEVWHLDQVGPWGKLRYGHYPPGTYVGEPLEGFRAGSYTGYGQWRDTLAKVGAGFVGGSEEAWSSGGSGYPFEELINYSDADGYIASPVTDKLCQDFTNFQDEMEDVVDKAWLKIHPRIELDGDEKDWFLEKWDVWKNAMCEASQDGAVIFR